MTRLWLCVVLGFALGCSGSEKSAKGPGPVAGDGGDAGAVAPTPDAGSVEPGQPLTADECKKFIRHVLVLGVDEMRATKPANEVPTEEQLEEIFQGLIRNEEQMARCSQQPRWAYDCAMKASSTEAIAACETR